MKFERNMIFSVEEFSDGKVLLYDDVSEVYHILNSTAAHALTILEKYGYEESKKHYVKWAKQTFDGIQNESLEEDYDILIRDLLDKRILSYAISGSDSAFDVMSIENQIADKQSEVKSLIQLNLKSGSNTEKYEAEIAKIYAEIMTLRQQLKRAENEVENNIKINEGVARAAKWIEENGMVFDEYDDVIIRRLVDTIQVNGDDTITVFLKGVVQITQSLK